MSWGPTMCIYNLLRKKITSFKYNKGNVWMSHGFINIVFYNAHTKQEPHHLWMKREKAHQLET